MEELIKALQEKFGAEVLSEEVEADIKAQLEIQINEEVKSRVADKEKEIEESTKAELTEFKENMAQGIEDYLDYAVEKYFEQNRVEMESGIKVEMAEQLMSKIKDVFKENYVEIPEDKVDVVSEMEAKLAESVEEKNSAVNELIESKKEKLEVEKALKFVQMTEGMTQVEKDKVVDLMEGLTFADIDDFEKKVKIVIETKVKDATVIAEEKEVIAEDLDKEVIEKKKEIPWYEKRIR